MRDRVRHLCARPLRGRSQYKHARSGLTRVQRSTMPGLRQYLLRCAHGASQIQRQHRICLSAEFQGIAEYVTLLLIGSEWH